MAQPLRVLIIEDSEDDALLLLLELKRGGYEPVCERVDTPESLKKMLDQQQWDIILADFSMPSFTAVDALEIVQKSKLDIPFIVVSGTVGEDVAVSMMKQGAHDYLMKDNLARLVSAIRRELKEAAIRREHRETEMRLMLTKFSVDTASLSIFWIRQNGMFLYVNDTACRKLGYSHKELSRMRLYDIDTAASPERRNEHWEKLKAQKKLFFETQHVTREGKVFPVEVRCHYLRFRNEEYEFAFAEDITQRKEVVRERDRLFNYSVDMLCIAGFDGYFKLLNPAWEKTLGWTNRELCATPYIDFVHRDDRALTIAVSEQLMAGEEILSFENRYLHKNGTYRWISWNAFPLVEQHRIFAVVRDITDHKSAEEKIMRTLDLNQTIIEMAPFGIYIIDAGGEVRFVNRAMLKISGISSAAFMGLNMLNLPEHSKSGVSEKIEEGLKGNYFQIGPVEFESFLDRKNAALNITGIPVTIDTERKLVIIVEDITESKRLDRMKDEFVGTVSHELRTPLTIIKEGISLVVDEIQGSTNQKQKHYLSVALKGIERLARIINDLLDISRIESGTVSVNIRKMDLNSAVRENVQFFNKLNVQKGVEIRMRLLDTGAMVYADRGKIIQVLSNLIGNALYFTESGHITVSLKDAGEDIECSVADTGTGIAQRDLPHLFNKFEQFGRKEGPGSKGTGLGLAICKGLVEMNHGTIRVKSTLNKGTTITFSLPKKKAPGS